MLINNPKRVPLYISLTFSWGNICLTTFHSKLWEGLDTLLLEARIKRLITSLVE